MKLTPGGCHSPNCFGGIEKLLKDNLFTFRRKGQGLRKKLVDEIIAKGIHDEVVLEAMRRVPRHYFLDKAFLEFAYVDKAFPIAAGQSAHCHSSRRSYGSRGC